jgi:hypothetical protein|tara:strand:- start:21 stop:227 length:207 start_codon:yes stop_codon:yes gene_type:complete
MLRESIHKGCSPFFTDTLNLIGEDMAYKIINALIAYCDQQLDGKHVNREYFHALTNAKGALEALLPFH